MSETMIFAVGGAVQASGGTYLARNADGELLDICRRGDFAYVLTPRQLGKSSLMVRTSQELQTEGFRTVIIDLSEFGVEVGVEQWYLGLLTEIQSQLGLKTDVVDWWHEHSHQSHSHRLTLFFREVILVAVIERIVIFVDEIDTTLSLRFTDDFYAAIRYLFNTRPVASGAERLSFVLIGVAAPDDLISDPQRTPFNIGHRVELSDFTFDEAIPLASGLGLPPDEAKQVLGIVMEWTAGHPYLTQRLCRAIAGENRSNWSKAEVDQVVCRTFFGEMSQKDNNLLFVRDMLTRRAPQTSGFSQIEGVLNTYREVRRGKRPVADEELSIIKSHLKLSGIALAENGRLRVRNKIYREVFDDEWVKEHLPINLSKQLRRSAYFLGLVLLFFSIPTAAVAIIQRNLAVDARELANQQRQRAESALEEAEAQRQIAEQRAKEADELRRIAEDRSRDADKQRNVAESLRRQAEKQQNITEGLYQKTEEQRRVIEQIAAANQLEAQANRAITAGKLDDAKLLLAKALTLNDRRGTRERLLEVQGRGLITPLWISSSSTTDFALSFSPDGKLLATAGESKTIHIWDSNSGNIFQTLIGHTNVIPGIVFFSNERIASVSTDQTVRIWDIKKGIEVQRFEGLTGLPFRIAVSPDGRTLAVRSLGDVVKLWDIETGREIRSFVGSEGISEIAFSPDGQTLAFEGADQSIWLWNTKDSNQLWKLPGIVGPFGSIVFNSDGRLLALAGGLRIWLYDINKRTIAHVLYEHETAVSSVAFESDGRHLVSGSVGGTIRIWDVETGEKQLSFRGNTGIVTTVACSRDGRVASGGEDGRVRLWDLDNTQTSFDLLGHKNIIFTLAFSPDGQKIASGSLDETLRLWDIKSRKLDFAVEAKQPSSEKDRHVDKDTSSVVPAAAFSPDGRWLAYSQYDNAILILDARTGRTIKTLNGHEGNVSSLEFSPNGKWLASGSEDATIRIWNAETGIESYKLTGHDETVLSIAFHSNRLLATGSVDTKILLWDIESGRKIRELTVHKAPVTSVRFSPDGRWLASAGSYEGTIHIYEVSTGKHFMRTADKSPVMSLAFSPDGRLAWPSKYSRVIHLVTIEPKKGEGNLFNIPVTAGTILSLAFSPDGRWLAYGGEDSKVHIQDLNAIDHIRTASPILLMEEAEQTNDLTVTGPKITPVSQQQLAKVLGEKINTTYKVLPGSEANQPNQHKEKSDDDLTFECPDAPLVATLNPFPVTFGDPGMMCFDLPVIRVASPKKDWPKNQLELEQPIPARAGDELTVSIYINNGANEGASPPSQTTAKNLQVRTFVDKSIGPEHIISVSIASDNTTTVLGSLKIRTGPNEKLKVIPNSGIQLDYRGSTIKKGINIGNNTLSFGDFLAGFDKSFFLIYKVKVIRGFAK